MKIILKEKKLGLVNKINSFWLSQSKSKAIEEKYNLRVFLKNL